MATRGELIQQQGRIDGALNDLIRQGEVGPSDQRDALGEKYNELWAIRTKVGEELAALPAPAGTPARTVSPKTTRRIRWGAVAVGGIGVLSLVGLIGWQLFRVHGRRKVRRKKRR